MLWGYANDRYLVRIDIALWGGGNRPRPQKYMGGGGGVYTCLYEACMQAAISTRQRILLTRLCSCIMRLVCTCCWYDSRAGRALVESPAPALDVVGFVL